MTLEALNRSCPILWDWFLSISRTAWERPRSIFQINLVLGKWSSPYPYPYPNCSSDHTITHRLVPWRAVLKTLKSNWICWLPPSSDHRELVPQQGSDPCLTSTRRSSHRTCGLADRKGLRCPSRGKLISFTMTIGFRERYLFLTRDMDQYIGSAHKLLNQAARSNGNHTTVSAWPCHYLSSSEEWVLWCNGRITYSYFICHLEPNFNFNRPLKITASRRIGPDSRGSISIYWPLGYKKSDLLRTATTTDCEIAPAVNQYLYGNAN